jgi:hypothetical protein
MATYNALDLSHLAGVPAQESDTFNPINLMLIAGESPLPTTRDMAFDESQDIPARTPVGVGANDLLVPAVWDADTGVAIKPIGITLSHVVSGAGENPGGPVLIQACVNMDMLNWPASFDTDAKKLTAFDGAPSPTSIVVRLRRAGATVSAP